MKFKRLLCAALFVAVACTNEDGLSRQDGVNLTEMEFVGVYDSETDADSKTVFNASTRKVSWEKSDKISVFSGETRTVFGISSINADGSAVFKGLAAHAASYKAVYPHSADNTASGSALNVYFQPQQTAVAGGFSPGSNVSVAVSADKNFVFRNAGSLIAFTIGSEFAAGRTSSIIFRAKKSDGKYRGLAGNAAVTINNNNLPVCGEGSETFVTLAAPEGGFKAGVKYMIAVCPGACAGMEMIFLDSKGGTRVWKNDTPVTLTRNVPYDLGVIEDPYSSGTDDIVYPTPGVAKTKTLLTTGYFTQQTIAEGITHYHYHGKYDQDDTQCWQNINVLEVDLNNEKYFIDFAFVSPHKALSQVVKEQGAVAGVNACYELEASYIRVDDSTVSEVDLEPGHLRYWKHQCALVGKGRNLTIVNKGKDYEGVLELYKSLNVSNIFSSAPMLIDNFDPVGETFVDAGLTDSFINSLEYEDYRNHQGTRQPHASVAITADNDLLLMTIDGRWGSGKAEGMNAKEVTKFWKRHFNPQWAMMLDGGGSTTMVIPGFGELENGVMNYPNDNEIWDHEGERELRTFLLVKPISLIDDEQTVDRTLPDNITIKLDMADKPFGTLVTSASQTETGEDYVYAYDYDYNGMAMTKNFTFTICKGPDGANYYYGQPSDAGQTVLQFGGADNAWIRLPAIPGRYLKSVKVKHGNIAAAKRFRLQEGTPERPGKYYSSQWLVAQYPDKPINLSVTIPTDAEETKQIQNSMCGKPYVLQFTSGASLRIFGLEVTYTAEKPMK